MTRQVGREVLRIDADAAIPAICASIRKLVRDVLRRRGAVVGISGGIDSAVVTGLCARALGPDRVLGLFTPERHSSPGTLPMSRAVAESQGVATRLEDISRVLEALGCYEKQETAIRSVIPDYGAGWTSKLVRSSVVASPTLPVFSLVAQSPDGREVCKRLPSHAYLALVAATNFKQRSRKMIEYHHADRLVYAVAGTANRLEYDQGFFVKHGDGTADFQPIAHLYKSQVYALGAALGVPDEVLQRAPTTDTYSMEQSQAEFYFSMPHDGLDLCLYARNHGIEAAALTEATGLTEEQIERVFDDIDRKRRATRYGHLHSLLVEPVDEIDRLDPS